MCQVSIPAEFYEDTHRNFAYIKKLGRRFSVIMGDVLLILLCPLLLLLLLRAFPLNKHSLSNA